MLTGFHIFSILEENPSDDTSYVNSILYHKKISLRFQINRIEKLVVFSFPNLIQILNWPLLKMQGKGKIQGVLTIEF